MGFLSFIRDMLVFDWFFGHRKMKSFWVRSQRENQRYTNHTHHDNCNGGYSNNSLIEYAQQELDDDLDSGMFDDDF